MKSIPNVSYTENDSTVSLLKVCLNTIPNGGFDFNTIRARNKVADKLEKVKQGDVFELEDEEYNAAKTAVEATRWTVCAPHLIKFAETWGL